MPIQITLPELLEAGFHYGHQKERWNPKMKPYIFGERNGVHIIDLSKTANFLNEALAFIAQNVGEGKDVLFVATKRQAQDIVAEEAERCGMYYVNNRWMGGSLTNFKTVKASIDRLKKLSKGREEGLYEKLKKAERLMIDREIARLEKALSGIRNMTRVPELVVMIDPNKEHLALKEAMRLGISVVSLTDTNCDPDDLDFMVPGNDDAIKSIRLYFSRMADAVMEGLKLREGRARQAGHSRRERGEEAANREANAAKANAYVAKADASEAVDETMTYSADPTKEAAAG